MSKRAKTDTVSVEVTTFCVGTSGSSTSSNNDKVDRFTKAIANHPGAVRDLLAKLLKNDEWEAEIYAIDQQHGKYFKRTSVAKLPLVILHNILGFIELRHHFTVLERICTDFQKATHTYTQAWSSLNTSYGLASKMITCIPMATWLPGIGHHRRSMITRISNIVQVHELAHMNGINFGSTLKHLEFNYESSVKSSDMKHFTQLQVLESFQLTCTDLVVSDIFHQYYELPFVSTLKTLQIDIRRPAHLIAPIFVTWSGWVNLRNLDLRGLIIPVHMPRHLPNLQGLALYVHSMHNIARDINKNIAYRQIMHALHMLFVQSAPNLTKLALDAYVESRLCLEIADRFCHTLIELRMFGSVEIVPHMYPGSEANNELQQITSVLASLSRLTDLQAIMFPPNCSRLPTVYAMSDLKMLILPDNIDEISSIDLKRLPRLETIDMYDNCTVPTDMRHIWTRSEFSTLFSRLSKDRLVPPVRRTIAFPA